MAKSYITRWRYIQCLLVLFLLTTSALAQQNSVSIGTQTINDKAVLMLVSPGGNQGLIVPVVSDRSAVGATASEAGMIVFDLSDNRIYYWDGSTWVGIGGGTAGADDWGSQVAVTSGVISGTGLTGDPIKLSDGTAVNQILVWDGAQWNLQSLSTGGTVTSISTGTGLTGGPITNAGTISVATGGITSNEILDNSITGADISTSADITANSFTGDGSGLTSVDATSIQGQVVSSTTPTSGQVLQYTGGQWVPTTLAATSGDITAVNTSNGITGGATNGDANLSLSNTGNGRILIGNGTTVNNVTVSGDAVLSNTGTLTLSNTGVTSGTYAKVTVDAKGRITSGSTLTAADIPTLTMSKISDAGTLATQSTVNLNQIVGGGATGGQILQFNSGTGFWEPATIAVTDDQTASEVTVTPSGNLTSTTVQSALTELQTDIDGLGISSLSDLSDVLVTTPSDANLLVYNNANSRFENVALNGDATITNTGTLTIADDAITLNKIADNGTTRAILANNASGNIVWLQPSGANQIVGTDGSSNLTFRTITTSVTGGGTGVRDALTAVDANLVTELAVREAINNAANSTTLADNVIPRASSGTFVASSIRDDGSNVGIQTSTPQTSLQIENTLHLFHDESSGADLLTHNVYESGPGAFNYTTSNGASAILMEPERIGFFTFPTGTADATLSTFSMRMNFTRDGLVINGDNLDNTAILDINSTSKGLLIPRMTTAQRNTIGTPANGLMIYNTSTSMFNFYDGAALSWATLGDNLGDHTATQNIVMGSNFISGDGGSEGIFIDALGNVAIGHNSPSGLLHLQSTTPTLNIESTGVTGGLINLTTPSTTWSVKNHSDEFRLLREGIEMFVVETDGQTGIGPSNLNPSAVLDVNSIGNTSATYAIHVHNSSSSSLFSVRDDGKIGMGTTSPLNKLDIGGNVAIGSGYAGVSTAPTNGLIVQGFVGIGTDDVGFPLEVHGGAGYVLSVEKEDAANTAYVRFMRQNTFVGSITETGGTVSYNAFTGSHLAQLEGDIKEGYLISMDNAYTKSNDYELSEPIYSAHITATANDPKVLGSYLHRASEAYAESENMRLIMAVGNGFMWVVDNGENLEIGDYLISSDVVGHAMLDKGEYDKSHIIARVAEAVNWDAEAEFIDGIKHKRISVFFESFTIDNTTKKLSEEIEQYKLKTKELEAKVEKLMQLLELNAKKSEIKEK